jgi:oligoendopeptidase F
MSAVEPAAKGDRIKAPPAELLKKYLGINLHDPNLVRDAVRLLESKLNLLEKEYSQ